MKKQIIDTIKNMQGMSLVTGLVAGVILGYISFSLIATPGTITTISDNHEMDMVASGTPIVSNTQTVKTVTVNPYMMGRITSEKQFLYNMKAHHEAAVAMAQQVLLVPSIHPEVKTLAKNIIDTQSTEIKALRDYIAAWKY